MKQQYTSDLKNETAYAYKMTLAYTNDFPEFARQWFDYATAVDDILKAVEAMTYAEFAQWMYVQTATQPVQLALAL